MARKWRRSPEPSPRYNPEAGFSLVEVLAALAIASLALILSMQLLLQSARVDTRLLRETAARDLARRLLVEGSLGQGDLGALTWAATLTRAAPGLALHRVAVTWPGGPVVQADRFEPSP